MRSTALATLGLLALAVLWGACLVLLGGFVHVVWIGLRLGWGLV